MFNLSEIEEKDKISEIVFKQKSEWKMNWSCEKTEV